MNEEFAFTPCLSKAIQIYTKTFGLIPPVFVDIKSDHKVISLKLFCTNKTKIRLSWSLSILSFFIGVWLSILASFLKTMDAPLLTTFQIVVLILYLSYIFIVLTSVAIFVRSKHILTQLNKFIHHGLNFGKTI